MQLEANIIYRIAKGDEKALDAFMDHYSQELYRIAYSYTGSKEVAEEVVSDVFFEIWNNRRKLLEVEYMDAYVHTIATRRSIDQFRATIAEKSANTPLDENEVFFAAPIILPDEEIISKEQSEILNSTLEELPPKCRQVFTLARIEKLSYSKISSMLNISVATINYHVKYAIDTFKSRLFYRKPPD